MRTCELEGFRGRVEVVVAQIPYGRVMTYDQLAVLCGNAVAVRVVGGTAHFGNPGLPWQRVVDKSGGIAKGYPGGRVKHRQALEAEGIALLANMKVDTSLRIWPLSEPVPYRRKGLGI